MEPVILVTSLLLAAAPGDNLADKPSQDAASSQPPAAAATQDAKPAQSSATRKPRTTSPPGTTPMPPMPNVDKGIQLPTNKAPEKPSAGEPDQPVPDSASPRDDSVKPVPAPPSKPGEPGVRPL
jgi:hypothetical protein